MKIAVAYIFYLSSCLFIHPAIFNNKKAA